MRPPRDAALRWFDGTEPVRSIPGPKVPNWNVFLLLKVSRCPVTTGSPAPVDRKCVVSHWTIAENTFYGPGPERRPVGAPDEEGATMPTQTRPAVRVRRPRPQLLPRSPPRLRPPAGDRADLLGRGARAVGPDPARGHHLRVDPRRHFLLGPGGAADPVGRPVDHRSRRRAPHPPAAPPQPGVLPADDPGHGAPGPPGGHRGARRASPTGARATSCPTSPSPSPSWSSPS